MKKTLIIIAVCVVLALGILFAAASVVVYSDDTGNHIALVSEVQLFSNKDLRKFTEIELKTDNLDVQFIAADDYGLEFMVSRAGNITFTNEQGKLTVTETANRLLFYINAPGKNDYLKVYYPKDAGPELLSATGVSGEISFEGIAAKEFKIKTDSGNVIMNIPEAGESYNKDISVVSGSVTIDGAAVENKYKSEDEKAENSLTVNSESGTVTVNFKGRQSE